MKHRGTKETTELVIFAITAIGAFRKAYEDQKISLRDAFTLFPVVKAVPEAFAGLGEIPSELADLDPVEAEQLVGEVEAHFGGLLPSGRAADIIDAILGILPQIANLSQTLFNPPPKAELAE